MPNQIPNSGTILLVDDIEENIRTVLRILDTQDVIPCTSGQEALHIMEQENINLILLDIMMPDMNGFQVAEKIRANPLWKDIPIIFLTAKHDEDSIEKAYDMGGHDYITKPFLPRELKVRVDFQLRFYFIRQRLEYIAAHDPLTGIYNRRKFFEIAKQFFKNSIDGSMFVIMLDIDHFKKINDKYGHNIGDEALKHVTSVISKSIEQEACFARLGGEEFVIAIHSKTASEANMLAEKIRIDVANSPVNTEETSFACNISIGVAQKTAEYKTIDELLNAADEALYEAKDGGRNRTIFRNLS